MKNALCVPTVCCLVASCIVCGSFTVALGQQKPVDDQAAKSAQVKRQARTMSPIPPERAATRSPLFMVRFLYHKNNLTVSSSAKPPPSHWRFPVSSAAERPSSAYVLHPRAIAYQCIMDFNKCHPFVRLLQSVHDSFYAFNTEKTDIQEISDSRERRAAIAFPASRLIKRLSIPEREAYGLKLSGATVINLVHRRK